MKRRDTRLVSAMSKSDALENTILFFALPLLHLSDTNLPEWDIDSMNREILFAEAILGKKYEN